MSTGELRLQDSYVYRRVTSTGELCLQESYVVVILQFLLLLYHYYFLYIVSVVEVTKELAPCSSFSLES
jgi:hypothetical protein